MNLPALTSRNPELSGPSEQAAGFVLASTYKDTESYKNRGSGAITTSTVRSLESKFSPFLEGWPERMEFPLYSHTGKKVEECALRDILQPFPYIGSLPWPWFWNESLERIPPPTLRILSICASPTDGSVLLCLKLRTKVKIFKENPCSKAILLYLHCSVPGCPSLGFLHMSSSGFTFWVKSSLYFQPCGMRLLLSKDLLGWSLHTNIETWFCIPVLFSFPDWNDQMRPKEKLTE